MATSQTQQQEKSIDYSEIVPRDVIGFHVFDPEMGMGTGEVVRLRRIRGEPHFDCDIGDKTVARPVDQVMDNLRKWGYELAHEPWDVVDSLGDVGIDEDEIRERRGESWKKLAAEFGVTEDEIRDIIIG